jgi:hypothetical protein
MSKKDRAQEQQHATVPVESSAVTLADVLKDIEGVTVSDDKRLRVTAADKETLTARVEAVMKSLEDNYTVTVSPTYGDAAALGCVWNDLTATIKK